MEQAGELLWAEAFDMKRSWVIGTGVLGLTSTRASPRQ